MPAHQEGGGADPSTSLGAGGGYRLRGEKVWVTSGAVAEMALVFAATRPGEGSHGITCFLVPMSAPGLTITPSPDTLGVHGLGCVTIALDDVFVGADSVVGTVDAGFDVARRALQGGRVAIAAQALGVGRAALDEAVAYARRREAFGHPIAFQRSSFSSPTWQRSSRPRACSRKAADTGTARAAGDRGSGHGETVASEAAHRAADRALQILRPKVTGAARRSTPVRDIRAAEIYQHSEIQRPIIARSIVSGL
jgi:alkylation response protein AidB-like acyl-CoA dehydrogenase